MTQQAPSGEYAVEMLLSNDSVTRRTPGLAHTSLTDVTPQPLLRAELKTQEGLLLIEIRREPGWVYPTLHSLNQLTALLEDWDSYGARPIRRRVIMMTIDILNRIMRDESPAPCIVPTVDGGAQLEWHRAGIDFEITIGGGGNVSASYAEVDGADPWEDDGADFERFTQAINSL